MTFHIEQKREAEKMADREKLIRAMEYCTADIIPVDENDECLGDVCPFKEGGYESGDCQKNMIRAALALLKEQEPRVLSLGEAIEGKNGLEIDPYVFGEIKGREDIFIGSVSDISHYNYPDLSFRVGESFRINRNFSEKIYLNIDYMKKVRCWTHKPSIEQRKAVKWDETTEI